MKKISAKARFSFKQLRHALDTLADEFDVVHVGSAKFADDDTLYIFLKNERGENGEEHLECDGGKCCIVNHSEAEAAVFMKMMGR